MKIITLFIAIIALIFSYLAYSNTKNLDPLIPLAQTITKTMNSVDSAKEATKKETSAAREKLSKFLHELAEEVKR